MAEALLRLAPVQLEPVFLQRRQGRLSVRDDASGTPLRAMKAKHGLG